MTFTRSDWDDLSQALDEIENWVTQFHATQDRRHLNDAVLAMWRFAEYSMNAGRELLGERTDRGHDMGKSAALLKAEGMLLSDYTEVLEKLERFRRKIDYRSYSREKKSLHFNRQNVLDCLTEIQSLRVEMVRELTKAKKLR